MALTGTLGGALVGAVTAFIALIAYRLVEGWVGEINTYVLGAVMLMIFFTTTLGTQGLINAWVNRRYLHKGGKLQRWRNIW